MAIEKGQVGLDWLKVQSAEVIRLADEYEVSKYLEYGFEACGRSMIWLGDMMAEVAGMRTCCLKVNRQGSVDRALVQFGQLLWSLLKLYKRVETNSKYSSNYFRSDFELFGKMLMNMAKSYQKN